MKIFVGIPARDGRVCAATAISLLNEKTLADYAGIELQFGIVPGCSAPHFARDQIARDFLKSDCDRLASCDDDVSFEPGMLIKLASHPVDVVGGAYRFKQICEAYPVQWLDKPELWADPDTGLLEVSSLPGGFMSVRRTVFEQMQKAHPERAYAHMGHALHAFYCMPYGGGEDAQFCHDWRALGGKVWLDPEIPLTHNGGLASYRGHIGNWLRGPRNQGTD